MSHSSLFSFQWSSLSLQDPRLLRQLLYSIKPTSHCQELTVTFIPFFILRSLFPSPVFALFHATTSFDKLKKISLFFTCFFLLLSKKLPIFIKNRESPFNLHLLKIRWPLFFHEGDTVPCELVLLLAFVEVVSLDNVRSNLHILLPAND